jgi:hypothetical protein
VYAFCADCGWTGGNKVPKRLLPPAVVDGLPVLRDSSGPRPPRPAHYPVPPTRSPRPRRGFGERTANGFRSDNEERIAERLGRLDVDFEYEPPSVFLRHPTTGEVFEYVPDFRITGNPNGIRLPDYIEVKDNNVVNDIAIVLGQPVGDWHGSPRRFGPTRVPSGFVDTTAMAQQRAYKGYVLALEHRVVVWLIGGVVNSAPPVVAFGPDGQACSQRASIVAGTPPVGGYDAHLHASILRLD